MVVIATAVRRKRADENKDAETGVRTMMQSMPVRQGRRFLFFAFLAWLFFIVCTWLSVASSHLFDSRNKQESLDSKQESLDSKPPPMRSFLEDQVKHFNSSNFLPHIARDDVCTVVTAGALWDGHFKAFCGRHLESIVKGLQKLNVENDNQQQDSSSTARVPTPDNPTYDFGWFAYDGDRMGNDNLDRSVLPQPWWSYSYGSFSTLLFRSGTQISPSDYSKGEGYKQSLSYACSLGSTADECINRVVELCGENKPYVPMMVLQSIDYKEQEAYIAKSVKEEREEQVVYLQP